MKNKKKKPNRKLIETIRFMMQWGVPVILFLISFFISFFVPSLLYFNNNKFNITMMTVTGAILFTIFILISVKLTKSWWKWLHDNNIIR